MPAISISGFARSKQKAMRRDLERRLQRLEPARSGSSALEIWVTDDDGMLCSPRGERNPRQTFDPRQPGRRGGFVPTPTDGRVVMGGPWMRAVSGGGCARPVR